MRDKYDIYRAAQAAGGPCPTCGWRDGDGVRTCFYDNELGIVKHADSYAAAERTMTEAQRTLYKLRMKLLPINPELRERYIQAVIAYRTTDAARRSEPIAYDLDKKPVSVADFAAQFRSEHETEPTAADAPYCDWLISPWWQPRTMSGWPIPDALLGLTDAAHPNETAYHAYSHEPHPNCGGMQQFVAPYHYRCGGCGVEVKLWEHGIDPDVG